MLPGGSRNTLARILPLAIGLAVSRVALANAGTPLMWLTAGHLIFGNALIGIAEGLLIGWVFRTGKTVAVFVMIAANYFSMICGIPAIGLFRRMVSSSDSQTLFYRLPCLLWGAVIGLVALTVLLEWPFCWALLRKKPHSISRSFLASVLVQAASYIVLACLYLGAGSASVYTEANIDGAFVKTLPPKIFVYFVSREDGDLYRIRLNGQDREMVCHLDQPRPVRTSFTMSGFTKLYAVPSPDGEAWDLLKHTGQEDGTMLVRQFAPRQLSFPQDIGATSFDAADLRPPGQRDWDVHTGFWAIAGLRAENVRNGDHRHISLETPFVSWAASCATVVPGDKVVYQLGPYVVVFDLETRQLGFLAIGAFPFVGQEDREE